MKNTRLTNYIIPLMKKLIFIIPGVLLSVFLIILSSQFYLKTAPQLLSFEIYTQKPIDIQCFYSEEATADFKESDSIKEKVAAADQFTPVRIGIPCTEIKQLRIDLGESPGEVKLRNLKLTAESGEIDLEQNFSGHDYDEYACDNAQITLKSARKNPHIIYNKPFHSINKTTSVDFYFLFISIIISALIGIGCSRFIYLRNKATSSAEQGEHYQGSILFISVFCVLLICPWVNLSKEKDSISENRRLSPYPDLLYDNGGVNTGFGKQFDSWFQDHSAFRDSLTTAYFNVKTKLSAIRETSRVIMYNNNWMFSKAYHESATTPYTSEQIALFTSHLQRLNNWCNDKNIKLYVLICPTKEELYAEFNKSASMNDAEPVAKLQQHLKDKLPELKFIYPIQALRQEKEANPSTLLHYKSDTHQTEDGAYVMYRETMKVIQQDFPDINIIEKDSNHLKLVRNNLVLRRDEPLKNNYYEGGLYHNLHLEGEATLDTQYNHYECNTTEATCTKGEEPMEFHFNYTPAKYTAMLLGDSYSSYQQLWFRYSFNSLWRVRANNGVNGSVMKMQRWESKLRTNPPDVLIICICSGRLYLHIPALYD